MVVQRPDQLEKSLSWVPPLTAVSLFPRHGRAYSLCRGMSHGRAPGSTGGCTSAWNGLNCCRSTSGGCKTFPDTTAVTALPAQPQAQNWALAPTPETNTQLFPALGGLRANVDGWASRAGNPMTWGRRTSPHDQLLGVIFQVC